MTPHVGAAALGAAGAPHVGANAAAIRVAF
jgi:hypothetical protein